VTANRVIVAVTLACHCLRDYASPWPQPGEVVVCPRHGVTIVQDAPSTYRARCLRCTYGHNGGTSLPEVEGRVRAHIVRHPTHPVQVKSGRRLVAVWNRDEQQDTLPNSLPKKIPVTP
jgi:hypothetical protein